VCAGGGASSGALGIRHKAARISEDTVLWQSRQADEGLTRGTAGQVLTSTHKKDNGQTVLRFNAGGRGVHEWHGSRRVLRRQHHL